MNTLIVHKGTGTIIDADESYVLHGDFTDMDDEQIIDMVTSEGNYPATHCYAVMYGSPIDGFVFEGPFWDYDSAIAWGETDTLGDWYVIRLRRGS